MQAGTLHQQLDLAVADRHTAAEGEFGMDPPAAVDPAEIGVDLPDQIGQPRVPHGTLGLGAATWTIMDKVLPGTALARLAMTERPGGL
ncbi:hypothetical protein ACWDWO_06335 [Actinopolymorpha singaporensis]